MQPSTAANNGDHETRYAACGTCTVMLVRSAYRRAPWFRLVREPLRLGMVIFGWCRRIDRSRFLVYTENCRGCVRFTKIGLKQKSALFRLMNNLVNPLFDRALERILTEEEMAAAKEYALEATQKGPPKEIAIKGAKLGESQNV